jgi:hypothetical protein
LRKSKKSHYRLISQKRVYKFVLNISFWNVGNVPNNIKSRHILIYEVGNF